MVIINVILYKNGYMYKFNIFISFVKSSFLLYFWILHLILFKVFISWYKSTVVKLSIVFSLLHTEDYYFG